jgi:ATP synthase protein I
MIPASSIGLVFVLSIVIGTLIGVWLDAQFDTKPWLTLFFLAIGIASGIKNAYMFYKKAERLMNEEESKNK